MKFYWVIILSALLCCLSLNSLAQQEVEGTWNGDIKIHGIHLKIIINLEYGSSLKGTIDIPEQGARNLRLSNIDYNKESIRFELLVGTGVASFDGDIKGDLIEGVFAQAGLQGSFNIRKVSVSKQEPVVQDDETIKFREENVSFNNGDVTLAGTLTIPLNVEELPPAVILLSGSGPQNRDEEILGFKPFKILAEKLSSMGIAVLRYDDRGVGESNGPSVYQSTMDDFAEDALSAFQFLKSRTDINPAKIGILGHSEGGIVGPMAASREDDLAFVVLMAAPAVPGAEIIRRQTELIMRANGEAEEEIKHSLNQLEQIIRAVNEEIAWEEVETTIKESLRVEMAGMSDQQRASIEDEAQYINTRTAGQMMQFRSPWFQHFIQFDPSVILKMLDIPVLALFGELDLQVHMNQNLYPMTDAFEKAGNNDFKIISYSKGNHLFQSAENGSPAEYASLEKEFVSGMLDDIVKWILEQ